ncbi:unnamed protein product [Symbiodinium sp. CCMP2592]|nr:unnamed protein product [Symbiodinium sp. CCMP2592]
MVRAGVDMTSCSPCSGRHWGAARGQSFYTEGYWQPRAQDWTANQQSVALIKNTYDRQGRGQAKAGFWDYFFPKYFQFYIQIYFQPWVYFQANFQYWFHFVSGFTSNLFSILFPISAVRALIL